MVKARSVAENVVNGREFSIFKDLGKVPVGQKVPWLVRRLARAEAVLDFVPRWQNEPDKVEEGTKLWEAWRGSKEYCGKERGKDAT